MRIFAFILFIPLFIACSQEEKVDKVAKVELAFTGDMLFEGSNTLQMQAYMKPKEIAERRGIDVSQIKSLRVVNAVLEMDSADASITESLLLQMVSNRRKLSTIGTLSPITGGTTFKLNLAENTNILPYLKDSGATWVLDFNIAEDHMEEMTIEGSLELEIHYLDK